MTACGWAEVPLGAHTGRSAYKTGSEPEVDIEGWAANRPKAVSRNLRLKVPRAPFTSLSVWKPERPLDGLETGLLAQ